MTKLFVVDHSQGRAEEVSSTYEAAVTILGDDGHDFEIRADETGEGFWLWRSRFGGGGRKGGMVKNLIYSAATSESEAEDEIYAEVVGNADRYGFAVLTEAEYARLMADSGEDE